MGGVDHAKWRNIQSLQGRPFYRLCSGEKFHLSFGVNFSPVKPMDFGPFIGVFNSIYRGKYPKVSGIPKMEGFLYLIFGYFGGAPFSLT